LNVNNTISKKLSGFAASLYQVTGKSWKRGISSARLWPNSGPPMRDSERGFRAFPGPLLVALQYPEQAGKVADSDGIVSGIARGVDASGAIMIESRRKILSISEGEIVL